MPIVLGKGGLFSKYFLIARWMNLSEWWAHLGVGFPFLVERKLGDV